MTPLLSLITTIGLALLLIGHPPNPDTTPANLSGGPVLKTLTHSELVAHRKRKYFHPKRHKVVKRALSRTGWAWYRWGATGPRRFDCSGLIQWSFRQARIWKMPRTSTSQARIGQRTSLRHIRKGDLVKWPGHVALYIGRGKIVEAAKPGTRIRVRRLGAWSFDRRAVGIRLNYQRLTRK